MDGLVDVTLCRKCPGRAPPGDGPGPHPAWRCLRALHQGQSQRGLHTQQALSLAEINPPRRKQAAPCAPDPGVPMLHRPQAACMLPVGLLRLSSCPSGWWWHQKRREGPGESCPTHLLPLRPLHLPPGAGAGPLPVGSVTPHVLLLASLGMGLLQLGVREAVSLCDCPLLSRATPALGRSLRTSG